MIIHPFEALQAAAKYSHLASRHGVYVLTLEMTRRCNAKCDICNFWREPKQFEMEDFAPVVKRFDPLIVTLCGGEPLLRKDLSRQIFTIRQLPGWRYLILITNGALLSVARGLELMGAGLNQMNISLDYPDARHDTARHIPGLFDHLAEVVPALARSGANMSLNVTIIRENLRDLVPLATLARQWGVTINYTLFSKLPASNLEHALRADDIPLFIQVIQELCSFRNRYGVIRSSRWYLERCLAFATGLRYPGCLAGRRMIHVSPAGFVRPCAILPPKEHYLNYDPAQQSPVDCNACWMACRGEVEVPFNISRVKDLIF